MPVRRPKLEDFPFFKDKIELSHKVDSKYLVPGCREPDCIPSIDNPKWIQGNQAIEMWKDKCKIFLVVINPNNPNEVYAFPKGVMDLHEVVNFKFIDGTNVAHTYCPLCDTSANYYREIDGKELILGVSGLLYNSAVIIFDRITHSLFSQVYSEGIHGFYINKKLKQIPLVETTLEILLDTFSNAFVLNEDTGFKKRQLKYNDQNYKDYREHDNIVKFFPVKDFISELPNKTSCFHLEFKGQNYIITKNRALKAINRGFEEVEGLFVKKYSGGLLFFNDNKKNIEWNNWIPSTISYYFAARSYFLDATLIK